MGRADEPSLSGGGGGGIPWYEGEGGIPLYEGEGGIPLYEWIWSPLPIERVQATMYIHDVAIYKSSIHINGLDRE